MTSDYLIYYKNFLNSFEIHYEKFKRKLLDFDISDKLKTFLFYTSDSKGKLLRSFFAYRSCELFEIPSPIKENIALAIELFQSFTLIHDDLPSLDNDDFRRGKESLHKVVGEANAILIGDALSILPFLIFSDITDSKSIENYYPAILRLINKFSSFAVFSLIDGQILDLELSKENLIKDESKENLKDRLLKIYEKKTAYFFAICLSIGALIKGKGQEYEENKEKVRFKQHKEIERFNEYEKTNEYYDLFNAGLNFGLAFQLIDDVEDYENKKESFSFPNLFGLEKTKTYIKNYLSNALKIIEKYDKDILYPYLNEFFNKFR